MMLVLVKNLELEDKEFFFSCYYVVDMRKRLNYFIGNEQMVFLVFSLLCFYKVNQKMLFWGLVR